MSLEKIHTKNPSEVGVGFKTALTLMQNKAIPFQMFGLSTFKATSHISTLSLET